MGWGRAFAAVLLALAWAVIVWPTSAFDDAGSHSCALPGFKAFAQESAPCRDIGRAHLGAAALMAAPAGVILVATRARQRA